MYALYSRTKFTKYALSKHGLRTSCLYTPALQLNLGCYPWRNCAPNALFLTFETTFVDLFESMKHRFTCITTNKPPCWKAWEPSLQLRFFRCPCMSLRLGRSWSVFAQVRWCASLCAHYERPLPPSWKFCIRNASQWKCAFAHGQAAKLARYGYSKNNPRYRKKQKEEEEGRGEGEMLSWKNQRFRKTPLNISRCGLFVNRRVSTFVKFTLLSLKHAPPSFLSTPTPNSSFCSGPNFSKLSRRTREEMLAKSFLLSWKLASLVHRNTNKVPRTRSHKTTAKLI